MRLGRRHVSLIELHRCAGEGAARVTALALQTTLRTVTGDDLVGIILGVQLCSTFGFSLRR